MEYVRGVGHHATNETAFNWDGVRLESSFVSGSEAVKGLVGTVIK